MKLIICLISIIFCYSYGMETLLQRIRKDRPNRVQFSAKKPMGVSSLQLLALQVIRQNLEKFNGTLFLNKEIIAYQLFLLSKKN